MALTANTSPDSFPAISGYHLVEQLYLGSRTAVYRAVQTATPRPVVIKVLRRDYPSFGELVQFRNQYAIAKNLPIPGIVQPLSLEPLGNGYALVMEDWGGVALGKYIQQQSLDLTGVLAIALQIADILHDLCQQRVVHKDIKPANILIQPESKQVKLIDFSIASLLPKETQEIQSPNILEGTLAYLAPEQTGRMNRSIDYRADFYGLGVTLYQLLTGTLPFTSDDPLKLIHCHIAKTPVPADQVNPDVPKMVAAIVTKLMSKNAEDRYQSAMGLKHDLEQCLTQWKTTGEIAEFELGQRDLSDRFLIPEKLYGRTAEVQSLLEAFDRVADGASELMLVAGFSGIGKTAVVNEVHKPIVRQRGHFIKGKFDQFNRNIPLSAFVQALRDLMGQLLSESDEELAQWRSQILTALGENGQVLIEVIPELELIIGQQPIATELSGSAAQNRFNLLFQKFIEVFTTAEHPLVLFLDDLQWADSASLQLIKLLMSDNSYLLMLGAYRDNEVSPVHPFILTVEEIRKAKAIINTITLAPLDLADTNHLVADTLKCSRELAQPLTELIDRKTQGNPFFTTQFLKALHEDGQIRFDRVGEASQNENRRYWECDIAQVNALALTDDVVEFMALQLQKLPAATQQVLKLAACVGNQFDLTTLAIVAERSPTDVAIALWKALQEGLILPTSQIYKFFQGTEKSDRQNTVNPKYRFLHDRVQQAAYSLIREDQQQSTHLAIARLLRQHTPDAELEANIFEIVNHWNSAIALLVDPLEKNNLAQLNLIAGTKAKAANAYEPALKYCRTGLDLLDDLGWQSQPSLMLALHEGAAAAAYLCGDFAQMEQWVSAIFAQKLDPLDRVKTYEIQIQAHSTQSQFPEAIAIAQNALEQFNIHLPKQPTPADIAPAMEEVAELLNGRTAHDLLDLPVITEAESLAIMQLLVSITATAHISAPLLFPFVVLTLVKRSIQKGNTALSAFGYSNYAILLSSILGDLDAAYAFGQLGLQLVAKFNARLLQPKVNIIVGLFIIHCKSHFRESLPLLVEAFHIGLEVGDLEFAGYGALNLCQCTYLIGKNLTTLVKETETYITTLQKLNLTTASNYSQIVLYTAQRLQGNKSKTELAAQLEQLYTSLISSNDLVGLHFYWVYKLTVSYLLNETEAMQEAAEVGQSLAAGVSLITEYIFYFYDSLTALATYSETADDTEVLNRVFANQTKLHHRAYHAPMNFQHKYDLVEAERYRILGNKVEAIALYDGAIAKAKENGYIQEEALANELAAKFYLNWGKEKIAQDYLTNAYYGYARWGAKAKIQDLEQRYPQLLAPILQQQRMALSATETVTTSLTTFQATATQSSSSGSTSISAALDLATVLKASQTLSGEIQLDKLLATLLHTVLENAGADKGALLMPRENQWFVEAVATVDRPAQMQSIALSSSSEVPHSLINTVKRSREPVVVVDALTHPTLAVDAYIVQQQPKSVLCTPILNQGKLVAMLYLENRVTVGAFTSDRIELLNFLCTQAAISLENARLYQQAQAYAQQLEQSQLQIVQSEKMASLGNLVAGVAHEINNPIGFLNGSISNAKDYVQDLLDYIALYQQHHPNAALPVQEKAEDIDLEFLGEDLPKLLDSMQGATDRIKSISTSLRTFSRADTEQKVSANLHEGIDSTLLILKYRLKANENRPAIEVIQDYGDLPTIQCFPGQLNQVFMNILANAIDMFDEMAQSVSFDQLKSHPQQITIRTTTQANQVQIQISDNGKGMTEEVRTRIFDHLFTTKGVGKGTGLGLAIARQIVVEKHGGSLEVQSELGRGSEFCIRLSIAG
ncbi:trifunctional serine/threonine-protein kinase/ATP-binding protein/sensor histidine kinase [Nostoc sp. CHAB 5836]|uniref:trifunctional serine/threonine-protein kinase/ATP-binding protein/sensor histidine kinase n=1 Tax=Nostoc sp. CHAB 5836 TaxID=2780404 RepID=UPI001E358CFC|nr:ATP-binding sensor histidine kinase [Nostoc sp. CHAB 5836]MCC5614790.1 trifunctional serine/threonine-protein kinase/ATP-binding protein/sensor histidine kinase [Nostoc sp. CHAB 5836]